MTFVDRLIQRARIRVALRFIPQSARVVDVGAHRGELFEALGSKLADGHGIEPLLTSPLKGAHYVIVGGFFPETHPDRDDYWDAVTLLAVLEHIPRSVQPSVAEACGRLLRDGGRVIVTVPSPAVDRILIVLRTLRLIDGMSVEEHYGFDPRDTVRIFSAAGLRLLRHQRFQLGLNNLYVFEKRADGVATFRDKEIRDHQPIRTQSAS
jgi:SAM-dependent methyltransferase